MSETNRFSLRVQCDSAKTARFIQDAMALELNQSFETRSKTSVQASSDQLKVDILARDARALRASIQSHAKLAIMLSSITRTGGKVHG